MQFKIDTERIRRIGETMGRDGADLNDCLAPDVHHLVEFLAHVVVLQDLMPGFLDEMLDIFIPHAIQMNHKATLGAMAQAKADSEGFGDEWRAAIEAGNAPNQKDYLHKMTELYMRLNDVKQHQAIKAMAEQTGRDKDSIRRAVTRSKKRKK